MRGPREKGDAGNYAAHVYREIFRHQLSEEDLHLSRKAAHYQKPGQRTVLALCLHDEYLRLGSTASERQAAYRALFRHLLAPAMVADIRDAMKHELVVGTSRFKDQVEAMTNRRARMGRQGRPSNKESDRQD